MVHQRSITICGNVSVLAHCWQHKGATCSNKTYTCVLSYIYFSHVGLQALSFLVLTFLSAAVSIGSPTKPCHDIVVNVSVRGGSCAGISIDGSCNHIACYELQYILITCSSRYATKYVLQPSNIIGKILSHTGMLSNP